MNSKQITTTNHNTPPSPLQLLYTIFKLYSRLFIDHSYVALAKCNISQQINHFIWDSLPTFYSEHWKITIVQTFKRCTLSHIQCSSINWTPNRMINSLDQIWNTQPFLSLTNESVTEIVSYNIFLFSVQHNFSFEWNCIKNFGAIRSLTGFPGIAPTFKKFHVAQQQNIIDKVSRDRLTSFDTQFNSEFNQGLKRGLESFYHLIWNTVILIQHPDMFALQ